MKSIYAIISLEPSRKNALLKHMQGVFLILADCFRVSTIALFF
ncbi:hypothetical protein GTCCBUS3UF5_20860 [Geobacillus thermoleovorans CCB_US3_UF5]|nr:hypothetical protein GTCCBUS3UF5_20860 [Geobacillus thermoleovorans CCB_US3_UF5]EQB94510.1 hypothetical protein GA8_16515 [Geobacillus sp. A8]KYD20072.1 hypothetical protein B4109_1543 [Geobacillus stearothermophilus]GAD13563.1 hypothetical protein GBL_1780 [Geobacillus kaustophilus GBlys]GAJ58849.1 hypothetical protein B23_2062 [Geobacillus thermoleovorans B23]